MLRILSEKRFPSGELEGMPYWTLRKQFVTREGEASAEPWRQWLGRSLALPGVLCELAELQSCSAIAESGELEAYVIDL